MACHKITATGLIKNVNYGYDAYPDRPGVVLNLTITDEAPLLSASIKPVAEEAMLWSCLQVSDPIYTKQLPPTEKALAFYAKGIESCLQSKSRTDEYAKPALTADQSGNPTGIVFAIERYKKVR